MRHDHKHRSTRRGTAMECFGQAEPLVGTAPTTATPTTRQLQQQLQQQCVSHRSKSVYL